jgi:hypothetical protein
VVSREAEATNVSVSAIEVSAPVTSPVFPSKTAEHMQESAIPSRLSGICSADDMELEALSHLDSLLGSSDPTDDVCVAFSASGGFELIPSAAGDSIAPEGDMNLTLREGILIGDIKHTDDVVDQKAIKSDKAEVNTQMWDSRVIKVFPPISKAEGKSACNVLWRFFTWCWKYFTTRSLLRG